MAPASVLSPNGQLEDRDWAFKAGFDLHLTTPISHGHLRDLLQYRDAQSVCISRDKRYS
jgi:CheY-like chemotaxis protein